MLTYDVRSGESSVLTDGKEQGSRLLTLLLSTCHPAILFISPSGRFNSSCSYWLVSKSNLCHSKCAQREVNTGRPACHFDEFLGPEWTRWQGVELCVAVWYCISSVVGTGLWHCPHNYYVIGRRCYLMTIFSLVITLVLAMHTPLCGIVQVNVSTCLEETLVMLLARWHPTWDLMTCGGWRWSCASGVYWGETVFYSIQWCSWLDKTKKISWGSGSCPCALNGVVLSVLMAQILSDSCLATGNCQCALQWLQWAICRHLWLP